jgi:hypothetical protein
MLPKKGNVLPYAAAIAQGLHLELGDTHQGVKTAMRWTGASERTVKNWFAGTNGPSGEHLIALMQHSDEVLRICLALAGREDASDAMRLIGARKKLIEMLSAVQQLIDHISGTSDA